jgi:hypothetical protein
MTQHTTKPLAHQRPTIGQRGGLEPGFEYALGNGGPAGSELPPILACCRCKCGAEVKRVDGVLKLDCGCRRSSDV